MGPPYDLCAVVQCEKEKREAHHHERPAPPPSIHEAVGRKRRFGRRGRRFLGGGCAVGACGRLGAAALLLPRLLDRAGAGPGGRRQSTLRSLSRHCRQPIRQIRTMGTRMALPAAPDMLPVGTPCAGMTMPPAAKSMPPAMTGLKTAATVPPSAAMSLMPHRATSTLITKPTQTFPLSLFHLSSLAGLPAVCCRIFSAAMSAQVVSAYGEIRPVSRAGLTFRATRQARASCPAGRIGPQHACCASSGKSTRRSWPYRRRKQNGDAA